MLYSASFIKKPLEVILRAFLCFEGYAINVWLVCRLVNE